MNPPANTPAPAFTMIDWAIVGGYLAVIIAIGALATRKKASKDEFFLAGRRIPVWAAAMSLMATTLSAATFIGGPEDAFGGDLTYLIWQLGQIIAVFIVAFLFLPAFFRAGTVTIYGYLGQRFGPAAKTAASAAFLIGRLLASGARLFIAGLAFSLILYGDTSIEHLIPAIILFGVIGTAYTAAGGIRAVIWTDTLQIVIVVGSAVLALLLLLHKIPMSVPEIVDALQTSGKDGANKLRWYDATLDLKSPYTIWTALAMVLFNMAAFGTDQDMAQRMLTTRSPKRAASSLIAGILANIPVTGLFLCLGLLLFIFYKRPDLMGDAAPAEALIDKRQVYPQFLLHHLPTGVRGLAMAGLFAAAMSSLDSAVNAMASSAVDDLKLRVPQRAAVVVMGATLTAFAIGAALIYDPKNDTLIKFALGIMTIAYGGLLGVFLTALLTRNGNTVSVVAALIAGAVAVLVCKYWPQISASTDTDGNVVLGPKIAFAWWMVIGTAVSFAICAAVPGGPRPASAAESDRSQAPPMS